MRFRVLIMSIAVVSSIGVSASIYDVASAQTSISEEQEEALKDAPPPGQISQEQKEVLKEVAEHLDAAAKRGEERREALEKWCKDNEMTCKAAAGATVVTARYVPRYVVLILRYLRFLRL